MISLLNTVVEWGILRLSKSLENPAKRLFGQHQPERMPVDTHLLTRWKAWVQGGTICSEMEAAAIFILSSIYRKRAGGIMLIGWNQEGENPEEHSRDLTPMIDTAIESVKILIERDRADQN